jgi:hypothetical protein
MDMGSEIYRFTQLSHRTVPDRIPVPEKVSQLILTSAFFSLTPAQPVIADAAAAKTTVSILGSLHAMANPLGKWQWWLQCFAPTFGNSKGKLTPKLNENITLCVTRASAHPDVARRRQYRRQEEKRAGQAADPGAAFADHPEELEELRRVRSQGAGSLVRVAGRGAAEAARRGGLG